MFICTYIHSCRCTYRCICVYIYIYVYICIRMPSPPTTSLDFGGFDSSRLLTLNPKPSTLNPEP